jgi:hypothetical protein
MGGDSVFLCGAGCVGAEFVPVVAVVADEVGDFAESFVGYDGYGVWRGAWSWENGNILVVGGYGWGRKEGGFGCALRSRVL